MHCVVKAKPIVLVLTPELHLSLREAVIVSVDAIDHTYGEQVNMLRSQ